MLQQERTLGRTSVRENHQPGIENDGEEEMAPGYECEREEDGPGVSGNLICQRHKAAREDDHHHNDEETENE